MSSINNPLGPSPTSVERPSSALSNTPRVVPLTCSGHTRPVVHLEFSDLQSDGSYLLLSSCKDGNPMLRDWTGDWLGTFIGHKGAVWSSKLSGNEGARAVTGSADFSAKVWDTYTGSVLHTFAHNHIVRTVAISANASHILTGGPERKLRLFDLNKAGDAIADEFGAEEKGKGKVAHAKGIRSVIWERDGEGEGRSVISAGEDNIVRWWDIRTLQQTHQETFKSPVTFMERSRSPAGSILTITSGKEVFFFDSARRTPIQSHTLTYSPSSACPHPILSDRFITGCTTDELVRIHTLSAPLSPSLVKTSALARPNTSEDVEIHKAHFGPVHYVSYSPDGQLAATGSEDGTIRLWQTFPGTDYGLWNAVVPNGVGTGGRDSPAFITNGLVEGGNE